jgi:arginyl-tRNA synthetase
MQILLDAVANDLEAALASVGVKGDLWQRVIGPARERKEGDVALPCFPFAKMVGLPPAEIAEAVAAAMNQHEALSEVRATNGYLNLVANPAWLAAQLLDDAGPLGAPVAPEDGLVLIEHTSANPNGPFHVGRARNAILGDTLVRLNRLAGRNVRAEYYVDDMGKQVGVLAWALANLSEADVSAALSDRGDADSTWSHKADHARVRWYQAAQAIRSAQEGTPEGEAIEKAIGTMVHASEHGDEAVLEAFEAAYAPVLEGMLETLGRLGITFDAFTKESTFVVDGSVAAIMDHLATLEIHGEADNGARFLDLGQRGLKGKTEFFYRRGDGSSLYATRDLAYHRWKWTQADRLLNVLGEDHRLQAKQVGLTLKELGEETPEVVFYSFIKLPEGKMSTRRGNVVFMDDLLEEAKAQAATVVRDLRPEYDQAQIDAISEAVATSAVRFNIIKVSPEKGFTFTWEEALSFEGGSAPFAMYAHMRACSISRKLQEAEPAAEEPSFDGPMPGGLVDLLRLLAVHSDVLHNAVKQHKPHLFALYMLDLANAYNGFYRDCMVIVDGRAHALHAAVSERARVVLHAGLTGLGLVPLERM